METKRLDVYAGMEAWKALRYIAVKEHVNVKAVSTRSLCSICRTSCLVLWSRDMASFRPDTVGGSSFAEVRGIQQTHSCKDVNVLYS